MQQTYEEFWVEVLRVHGYARREKIDDLRLGQRYYNMLPSRIARNLAATTLDPYYYNHVTEETHNWVRERWEEKDVHG